MAYVYGNWISWYITLPSDTMQAPLEWSVISRLVSCYRFEASHQRKGPHERRADVAGSVETRIIRVQTLDRNVRRCLKNKHIFNFQPMHFCWEKPTKEDHSKTLCSKSLNTDFRRFICISLSLELHKLIL